MTLYKVSENNFFVFVNNCFVKRDTGVFMKSCLKEADRIFSLIEFNM